MGCIYQGYAFSFDYFIKGCIYQIIYVKQIREYSKNCIHEKSFKADSWIMCHAGRLINSDCFNIKINANR